MSDINKQIYIVYTERVYDDDASIGILAFDNYHDAEIEYIKERNDILKTAIEDNYDTILVDDDKHYVITYREGYYNSFHDVLKLITRIVNDTTIKDL